MKRVVRVIDNDLSPGIPGKGECHEEVRVSHSGRDRCVDDHGLQSRRRNRSAWCVVDCRASVAPDSSGESCCTAERDEPVVSKERTRIISPAVLLRSSVQTGPGRAVIATSTNRRYRARRMQFAPKAVLFDFDGVLADSEPLHCQSYLETAAAMDIPLTQEQYFAELIGFDDRGAITKLYRIFERKLDERTIAEFLERKSKISLSLIRAGKFRPLKGVEAFVNALSERCAMGICSGALRSEIEGMLDGIGLRQFFSVITAAEDVKVGKPDPIGYILTAQRLGEMIGRRLQTYECLVVEDAPSVALRAREAGFFVLGVTTTYRANDWPSEIPTVDSLEPAEVLSIFPNMPLEKRT